MIRSPSSDRYGIASRLVLSISFCYQFESMRVMFGSQSLKQSPAILRFFRSIPSAAMMPFWVEMKMHCIINRIPLSGNHIGLSLKRSSMPYDPVSVIDGIGAGVTCSYS
jgi:hypothetical protein